MGWGVVLRRVANDDLEEGDTQRIREMLRAAFEHDGEGFTDDDWGHLAGGVHFVLEAGGDPLAHAAVVERELNVDGRPLRAGYVEAVATRPDVQRSGHGTRVMEAVNDHIRGTYELGALSTGSPAFYARLGWEQWLGRTAVRTEGGLIRTPHDDGGIMILATLSSPPLDRRALISCPWRSGDVW